MGTQKYYIGLDIGTGSVGWAAADEDYNILKRHGKALWGVRLFETAQTAAERRTFRIQRRRYDRRRERLALLQELFAEEIAALDPGFFLRMKESVYHPEDKRDTDGNTPALPYALFTDPGFTDKNYHAAYPTIYHLRRELIRNPAPHDVRLVYLAVHHILKHRGHFLFEGALEGAGDFGAAFDALLNAAADCFGDEEPLLLSPETLQDISDTLSDRGLRRTEKKKRLQKLLAGGENTAAQYKELAALLAGTKVKLATLFKDEELKQAELKELTFDGPQFEEKAAGYESVLGERYALAEAAKAVYDWAVLSDILGGYEYLCDAKTAVYEAHRNDLKALKALLRPDRKAYRAMFCDPAADGGYAAYAGIAMRNGKKLPVTGKRTREDFYKHCQAALKGLPESAEKADILSRIELGTFMPLQAIRDNGVIPHQLHLRELDAILKNAADYLPFLNAADSDGITVSEKVRSLLTFRIDYFVGPLNTRHAEKGHAWMKRLAEGKIYPWNYDKMVDKAASANEFMRRMTNKCTYLTGEDVLPKDSPLYSRFMVLNELNNLRLDGAPISVPLKQAIYNELFAGKGKVTQKKLRDWLKKNGHIGAKGEITGIDGDFKASLPAEQVFRQLGAHWLTDEDKEAIVQDIALFGQAPKMLAQRLRERWPRLTAGQVNMLKGQRFTGWGRLSARFLTGIYAADPETGEARNLITALWETNENLMQLLGGKYGYGEALREANLAAAGEPGAGISYRDIENLYLSPAVRRPVWQVVRIMRELEGILGAPPARVFVEVARENTDSGRTVSRKAKLEQLYRKCAQDATEEAVQKLAESSEADLRRDKLYLYLTQLGRCMYTGQPIPLAELNDSLKWDIDHIYPRSKTMDDSLNNRVLVRREVNSNKSDVYPLPEAVRTRMRPHWQLLLDRELIDKEKFARLTRQVPFTPEEFAGFISRQLVETNQSTRAVTGLLRRMYPGTEVVFSKAKVVSGFRQKFDLPKLRELNDLHHAQDAYLNIVCGNAYYVKFTRDAARFVKENPGRTYNLDRFFEFPVQRGSEFAWVPQAENGAPGTIATVKRWMGKHNMMVTRQPREMHGGLFDQQLMKKGKGQVPVKSGADTRRTDIEKYGGYNKAAGAYFLLAESEGKKGKRQRTIGYVPVYLAAKLENDPAALEAYCRDALGLTAPKVLIPKILFDTLFCVDGFYMHITGRQVNSLLFRNANQLILSKKEQLTLKKLVKFNRRRAEFKSQGDLKPVPSDALTEEELDTLYEVFRTKLLNSPYSVKLSAQAGTLEKGKPAFDALPMEDRCLVLENVLKFFQCVSAAADLKLIDGPGRAGIITNSMDVSKLRFSLIYQSVTGFYENREEFEPL